MFALSFNRFAGALWPPKEPRPFHRLCDEGRTYHGAAEHVARQHPRLYRLLLQEKSRKGTRCHSCRAPVPRSLTKYVPSPSSRGDGHYREHTVCPIFLKAEAELAEELDIAYVGSTAVTMPTSHIEASDPDTRGRKPASLYPTTLNPSGRPQAAATRREVRPCQAAFLTLVSVRSR